MLWSLIKILAFVVIIALLSLGAGYLMESSGGIQVTFAGTEYMLTPLQSVIAAVVLLVAVWVILKLLSLAVAILRFMNGDETAISRYFDRDRERRGYQALADGHHPQGPALCGHILLQQEALLSGAFKISGYT